MPASPSITTRFAPSPTGYLHIGGARTALFNFLFARHHGGRFLLRIEDTDKERSSQAAIDAIFEGMRWLNLEWDGPPVFQSERAARHVEVALALLAQGNAYRCYATAEELTAMREAARAAGAPLRYNGLWRDRSESEAPAGVRPVIRLRAPQSGETVIEDRVQGRVVVRNAELDDMILLRSDGTPTYMLAVVVDDHDAGVTHVVRGDDHLNNAFRQLQIIRAMGWAEPVYGHIPLIHGPDGAKLSKRHGALGVSTYRDMGFLPEAMENYLLRLGWGHGDDEILSRDEAIRLFDLDAVGRNPARLDMVKLASVNSHYLRTAEPGHLAALAAPLIAERLSRSLDAEELARLANLLPELTLRARTLVELAEAALFFFLPRPLAYDEAALKLLTPDSAPLLEQARAALEALADWTPAAIEAALKQLVERLGVGLGKIGPPLRAALCGTTQAPSIFAVAANLPKMEALGRISDATARAVKF